MQDTPGRRGDGRRRWRGRCVRRRGRAGEEGYKRAKPGEKKQAKANSVDAESQLTQGIPPRNRRPQHVQTLHHPKIAPIAAIYYFKPSLPYFWTGPVLILDTGCASAPPLAPLLVPAIAPVSPPAPPTLATASPSSPPRTPACSSPPPPAPAGSPRSSSSSPPALPPRVRACSCKLHRSVRANSRSVTGIRIVAIIPAAATATSPGLLLLR